MKKKIKPELEIKTTPDGIYCMRGKTIIGDCVFLDPYYFHCNIFGEIKNTQGNFIRHKKCVIRGEKCPPCQSQKK